MGQQQSGERGIDGLEIISQFDPDKIAEFHQQFHKTYPKGRLTKDDLIKVYKSAYPTGDPSKLVSELFRLYDQDGSGAIDFREFVSGFCAIAHGSEEDKLRLAFQMYDADGNGSISNDEMHNLVQAICKATSNDKYDPKVAHTVGENLFDKLDKNKNNRISLQEFIDGAKQDPTIINIAQPFDYNMHALGQLVKDTADKCKLSQ